VARSVRQKFYQLVKWEHTGGGEMPAINQRARTLGQKRDKYCGVINTAESTQDEDDMEEEEDIEDMNLAPQRLSASSCSSSSSEVINVSSTDAIAEEEPVSAPATKSLVRIKSNKMETGVGRISPTASTASAKRRKVEDTAETLQSTLGVMMVMERQDRKEDRERRDEERRILAEERRLDRERERVREEERREERDRERQREDERAKRHDDMMLMLFSMMRGSQAQHSSGL
jgi:hypothetical protein